MKEKQKHPNEVFEYEFINSSAALPHFHCSYSLSGSASCLPPSNLHPRRAGALLFFLFFFRARSKSCHSADVFFSPLPAGLKKKGKTTWLSVSDSFIDPHKGRGGRKRRKTEISYSVGTTDLQQVNDPLVKIYGCGRVGTTVAGNAGESLRHNLWHWSANWRNSYDTKRTPTSGQL